MSKEIITIYCDGACSGNHLKNNVGGWGAIISQSGQKREIYGGTRNTTNNRMELTACIKAFEFLETVAEPVRVYTDSAYLANCFRQKWYVNWQRNGWRNAARKPVENQDLWKTLLSLVDGKDVTFHKVKGHSGDPENERADELANRGMDNVRNNRQSGGENRPASPGDRGKTSQYRWMTVDDGIFLRLQKGVAVTETLTAFIKEHGIRSGTVSAIGALESVELGFFDREKQTYLRKAFPGIYELLSFLGNIAWIDKDTPFVHAHTMLGDQKYKVIGGHFFEAIVAVTMEIHISRFTNNMNRSPDAETGLNLLDFSVSR